MSNGDRYSCWHYHGLHRVDEAAAKCADGSRLPLPRDEDEVEYWRKVLTEFPKATGPQIALDSTRSGDDYVDSNGRKGLFTV